MDIVNRVAKEEVGEMIVCGEMVKYSIKLIQGRNCM